MHAYAWNTCFIHVPCMVPVRVCWLCMYHAWCAWTRQNPWIEVQLHVCNMHKSRIHVRNVLKHACFRCTILSSPSILKLPKQAHSFLMSSFDKVTTKYSGISRGSGTIAWPQCLAPPNHIDSSVCMFFSVVRSMFCSLVVCGPVRTCRLLVPPVQFVF